AEDGIRDWSVTGVQTCALPISQASTVSFARPTPNPARRSVSPWFSLPREAVAQLAIYDASGQRIRQLVSGIQPAGERTIAWDLRSEERRVGKGGRGGVERCTYK